MPLRENYSTPIEILALKASPFTPTDISIASATVGNNQVIAAAGAGLAIRVYRGHLMVSAAAIVTLTDGATVYRRWNFAAAGQIIMDLDGTPYAVTGANLPLILTSSAAVAITGTLDVVVSA